MGELAPQPPTFSHMLFRVSRARQDRVGANRSRLGRFVNPVQYPLVALGGALLRKALPPSAPPIELSVLLGAQLAQQVGAKELLVSHTLHPTTTTTTARDMIDVWVLAALGHREVPAR
jgi:hypothetical protein